LRAFGSFILLLGLWVGLTLIGIVLIFSKAFNESTIKGIIEADNGYEKISQMISESVSVTPTDSESQTDPQLSAFLSTQLKGPLIKQKLEEVIDKYFAWFKGEPVDMHLSLNELNDLSKYIEQAKSQGMTEVPEIKNLSSIELPTNHGRPSQNYLFIWN